MPSVDVDGLRFIFPDTWQITKYDDWKFYRSRFQAMVGGAKAIDLLALDPAHTAWLIEVKDYRQQIRTKPSCLAEEVVRKSFDTLAALLPAAVHAEDDAEKKFARALGRAISIRVVLHLEQPGKHSKLFPRAISPVAVQQKMRSLMKPVDAHPIVCESLDMKQLVWKTE